MLHVLIFVSISSKQSCLQRNLTGTSIVLSEYEGRVDLTKQYVLFKCDI